jgi:sugar lactone lactonase YvrE
VSLSARSCTWSLSGTCDLGSTQPPPRGGFNQQNGIAINPADDSLFVVDTFEQRVQKFNTASTCTGVSSCPAWELQFAGRSSAGTATEGVGYPRALTFGDGRVWIGDNNNDVQAWTPGGTSTSQPAQFVHRFGSQGKSPGQFSGGVQGLRVQGGRVYATDYAGCRLQVFDEAKLLTVGLGTSALEALVGDTGCTTMQGPRGVAVDPSNPAIVYVAETGANRITKWNLNLGSPGHPGGGTATRITSCGLSQPWGITYHAGAYYIGDVGHSRIMKLNPATNACSVVVSGLPRGVNFVEFDSAGRMYASDNSKKILVYSGVS